MTNDQIAASLDALNAKLDMRFESMDQRMDHIEKHMVTRSDVHGAVFQGLAFAAAAIVGTVVVLNAIGAFG